MVKWICDEECRRMEEYVLYRGQLEGMDMMRRMKGMGVLEWRGLIRRVVEWRDDIKRGGECRGEKRVEEWRGEKGVEEWRGEKRVCRRMEG